MSKTILSGRTALVLTFLLTSVFRPGGVLAQDYFADSVVLTTTLFDHYSRNGAVDDNSAYWEFNMDNIPDPNVDRAAGETRNAFPILNLVQDSLGADGLPVFNNQPGKNRGCSGCGWYNQNVGNWFKANTAPGKEKVVSKELDLTFTHLGQGVYQFTHLNTFFPWDDDPNSLVGLGIESELNGEGGLHNFGFTLHLRKTFVYNAAAAENQDFLFEGDDDVWVFLDGKLALDIGGIHEPVEGSFNLKEKAEELGIPDGKEIAFDFFYAERRVVTSTITITTSLPIVQVKIPPVVVTPPGGEFVFDQFVTLSRDSVNDVQIYYDLDGGGYQLYDGNPIRITNTTVLKTYAEAPGWTNSDTGTYVFTKVLVNSQILITSKTGLDLTLPNAFLNELDSVINIQITTPYAELDSIALTITSQKGDNETVILRNPELVRDATNPNNDALVFTIAVPFAYNSISGGIENGIIESLDFDNLSVTWTNPQNPSDVFAENIVVKPNPATNMYFEDLQGNVITEITEAMANNKFVLVIEDNRLDPSERRPILVNLLSSVGGDALQVSAVELLSGSGRFTATVDFGFAFAVNPSNAIIEGQLNPLSSVNSTVVTASDVAGENLPTNLTIHSIFVSANSAWIKDGNRDGQGDSVYIKINGSITADQLPDVVTNIQWPGAGTSKNAGSENISLLPGTDNIIVIDLSQDPYELATFAVGTPTLTLPNNPEYKGQTLAIQDSIGAVLVRAEKVPSDLESYEDTNGKLLKNPDTLIVVLSEDITPINPNNPDLNNLFLFIHKDSSMVHNMTILSVEKISADGLTWRITFPNDRSRNGLKAGDEIFLNPTALYTDANGNFNGDKPVITLGEDAIKVLLFSDIFRPIETVSSDPTLVGGGSSADKTIWIPPIGFDPTSGEINSWDYDNCSQTDLSEFQYYPVDCLSSVVVHAEGGYTANVNIFDNTGRWVHSHVQKFGQCGELENNARNRDGDGLLSWLVWNQKDDKTGSRVGSGVYIWKVLFEYENGRKTFAIFKQGIARGAGVDPNVSCQGF